MIITKDNVGYFQTINPKRLNSLKLKKVTIPSEYKWCNTPSEYWNAISNDIFSPPLCECGKVVSYRGSNFGYSTFCSQQCTANSKITRDKYKSTCLDTYGVENTFQADDFLEKSKKTKLDKYGNENFNNTEKRSETSLVKYGTKTPPESKQVKLKISKNSKNGDPEVIKKKQITHLKNYGYVCPFSNPDPTYLKNRGKATAKGLKKYYQTGSNTYRFLYVIETNDMVKIGITSNLNERLKLIKKHCKDAKYISITYLVNTSDFESYLHEKYDNSNIVLESGINGRTEWFSKSILNDVLSDIDNLHQF